MGTSAPPIDLSGCPDPVVSVRCLGDVPAPTTVTATGGCGGDVTPVFSEVQSNPGSSCHNVITRIWSASDLCGNSASCAQVITVNDDIGPDFTGCPTPVVNVKCLGDVPAPANVTALDNCEGLVTPIFSEVQSNPGSSCHNVITRIWSLSDRCGNSISCAQVINVSDDEGPQFTGCPPPVVTVQSLAEVPPPANVTALDNCEGSVTPIFSEIQSNPGSECNNTITRIWSLSDRCGNSISCAQVITVLDSIPPVLSGCPPPTLTVYDISQVPPPANVTAMDNCDGPVTPVFTEDQTNPGSSCHNVITRTWVAADSLGHSASCSQVITVVDNQPPNITGISVNPAALWAPNHTMQDVTVAYTSTDNCPGESCVLSISSNEPVLGPGSGHTDPDWVVVDEHHVKLRAERAGGGGGRIYTITITCTDAAGNVTTTSVPVAVSHDQSPPPKTVNPPKATHR